MSVFKRWNGTSWETIGPQISSARFNDTNHMIAPEYSPTKTYNVGDYVVQSDKLYKCISAIESAEEWTAAHWTQVSISGEVTDLQSALNDITSGNLYNPTTDTVGKNIDENGNIVDEASLKISDYIDIGVNTPFSLQTEKIYGDNTGARIFAQYDENKNFQVRTQCVDSSSWKTYTLSSTKYIRLIMGVNTPPYMVNIGSSLLPYVAYGYHIKDDSEHLPNVYDAISTETNERRDVDERINNTLTSCFDISDNLYNPATDSLGKNITSDGNITDVDYLKISDFIEVGINTPFSLKVEETYGDGKGAMQFAQYDENKNFQVRTQCVDSAGWKTYTLSQTKFIRLIMQKTANPFMVNLGSTLSEYQKYGEIKINDTVKYIPLEELKETSETYLVENTLNIYNPSTDEIGSIDSSGGIHPENTDYKHSDFIYIGIGNTVCVKTASTYNGTDGATIVAYYDSSKRYLAREEVNGRTYKHTMTGQQVYIRLVSNVNAVPYMANLGDFLLAYRPYGVSYTKEFDNHVQSIIEANNKLSKSIRWSSMSVPNIAEFDGYSGISTNDPSLSQLYALYDGLVTNYPDYVSKKDLGTDQSGNYHLYQYSFVPEGVDTGTVPFSIPSKPKVLLGSGTHGNGTSGDKHEMVVGLYYFFNNLCSNWKENDGLTYLRWNVRFEIIPVQNPWGYVNNNRRNSRGVDLNRNFSYGWRSGESGAVDYGGTAAFSEAESKIIKGFIEDNTDALFYYDIHTTAGIQEQDKMMYWSMLPNKNMSVIANDCIVQLSKKWDGENIGGLVNSVLHGYIDGETPNGFGSISQWVAKVANIPACTFEGFPNFKNSTETLEGDVIMRMSLDEIAVAVLNALRFFKYYM